MNLIESVENQYMKGDIPKFGPGDVVKVNTRIREGEKERIQTYEGTVIRRAHGGLKETFTVRRVAFGAGSERTFPLHSPNIESIQVVSIRCRSPREVVLLAASVLEDLLVSKNAEDNLMEMNVFEFACQQSGYKQIAGIDEAGRGGLGRSRHCRCSHLTDSLQH